MPCCVNATMPAWAQVKKATVGSPSSCRRFPSWPSRNTPLCANKELRHRLLSLLVAVFSIEVEHLCGVATHHLLLVLARQGPKQGVQGCLRFQSDGPEVRKIGAPEHLSYAYVRDGVVGSRIANEPV